MIQLDDIKVFGANTICMILAKTQNINADLQSILLMMTIMYTIARTVTEVQKYYNNKDNKDQDKHTS
jgi:hypothetical protein